MPWDFLQHSSFIFICEKLDNRFFPLKKTVVCNYLAQTYFSSKPYAAFMCLIYTGVRMSCKFAFFNVKLYKCNTYSDILGFDCLGFELSGWFGFETNIWTWSPLSQNWNLDQYLINFQVNTKINTNTWSLHDLKSKLIAIPTTTGAKWGKMWPEILLLYISTLC